MGQELAGSWWLSPNLPTARNCNQADNFNFLECSISISFKISIIRCIHSMSCLRSDERVCTGSDLVPSERRSETEVTLESGHGSPGIRHS